MFSMNPLLAIDFYKSTHKEQYPVGLTRLCSYYTPRMSRLKDTDKITFFGLQYFIKEYLETMFNEQFFSRDIEEVVAEYDHVLTTTLGVGAYESEKVRDLHKLGYLPIAIYAVPEGTRTKIGVPQLMITNTHADFVWLVNTLETLISCTLWHCQISAEVGWRYRQIVDKYVNLTCDDNVDPRRLLGDFSMRGQHSLESATKSSAAWLLSFYNTATVPAIMFHEKYYNADCTKEPVGYGAISTEHSVMCSNYAVDGDEITHIRRLLKEIYPNHNFSMVSDSYDYWNLVENILPQVKDDIMTHNGKLSIRGDSGDPVKVVVHTVEKLWDIFGGTTNSKGYKILDPHIGVIYGDSITPQRCEQIYDWLMRLGFAVNNVALGVGSFSMMCLETTPPLDKDYITHETTSRQFQPYTRDTFGIAIKATYAEMGEFKKIPIYKAPKENAWKKSQKGCCVVSKTTGDYTDGWEFFEAAVHPDNLLQNVWLNGKFIKETSLKQIREVMYD